MLSGYQAVSFIEKKERSMPASCLVFTSFQDHELALSPSLSRGYRLIFLKYQYELTALNYLKHFNPLQLLSLVGTRTFPPLVRGIRVVPGICSSSLTLWYDRVVQPHSVLFLPQLLLQEVLGLVCLFVLVF